MAEKQIVCNQEAGCMSALFGRNCWVADSMLKLIISSVDEIESPVARQVEEYAQELRAKNKEYWDDMIRGTHEL